MIEAPHLWMMVGKHSVCYIPFGKRGCVGTVGVYMSYGNQFRKAFEDGEDYA
jgi:hypothetical protein